MYVGVAAYSGKPTSALLAAAEEFVEGLSSKHCSGKTVLLVGGYWGLMRVVVDLALERGLKVVIIAPLEREDVEFPREAIVIKTGVSYRLRSVILARSSDVLVVLGGAAGSIQEAVTAYTEAKPIVLVAPTGMDTDKLTVFRSGFDYRRLAPILVVESGKEASKAVCETAWKKKE